MKLEECLAVNDNPQEQNEADETSRSIVHPATVKRMPVKGKGKSTKPAPKGRARRGRYAQNSDDSSDSEVENNPRGRRGKQRQVSSDSEDETPRQRKVPPQSNRKQQQLSSARPTRSGRSKIIEEPTSSGENVLRENNSFEN